MAIRVGINGFGRTGRAMYRAVLGTDLDIDVVGINDLGEPPALARLLTRDSVHGPPGTPVTMEGDTLSAGRQRSKILRYDQAEKLPWGALGADVVAECTGRRTTRASAEAHLTAGARRVVVSAPCQEADATFVIGVNEDSFDPTKHLVVSNASCTTNCVAILAKVLSDEFNLECGLMSTVHAYTGDQSLTDGLHHDPSRGKAAAINIVPTSTGAARSTGLVVPAVAGALDGLALRVPVPDGSITDLVVLTPEPFTSEQVNQAFARASQAGLARVLEYSNDRLVSSDIIGSTASCIFDASLTMTQGRLVKAFGWYDNETGYAARLAELCQLVGPHR